MWMVGTIAKQTENSCSFERECRWTSAVTVGPGVTMVHCVVLVNACSVRLHALHQTSGKMTNSKQVPQLPAAPVDSKESSDDHNTPKWS